MNAEQQAQPNGIRLDKWLWAVRFYKTRSLAKQSIEGGKVHYNHQKTKPSRLVEVGATLKIRQGFDDKTVIVKGLSDIRRGASDAALLYRETEQSVALREKKQAERRAWGRSTDPGQRPSKKQRRQIHSFRRDNS